MARESLAVIIRLAGQAPSRRLRLSSNVRRHDSRSGLLHQLNFPSAVPELLGERVRLRELTESDIPAWYSRATDTESADLAGDPVPSSIAEGSAWLQRHRNRFLEGAAIRWSIVVPPGSHSVGTVGLAVTSREHRVGELGIVVGRAYWHQGVGTAAARVALNYALAELGLLEVQAEVLQRNPASVRLLEKLGFQQVRVVPAEESPDGEAMFSFSLRAATASAA